MKTVCTWCIFAFCLTWAEACAAADLKGTPATLERENRAADEAGLTRIPNDEMLAYFKEVGLLIRIPEVLGVAIDPRLAEKWRWVRPWVAEFLTDLGADFYKACGNYFPVSSAVRTDVYHGELRKKNGNAAPATGNRRSSHTTGSTIDITKWLLTKDEIKWLRKRLLALEEAGVIEATEEFYQTVFHVMVLRGYGDELQVPALPDELKTCKSEK